MTKWDTLMWDPPIKLCMNRVVLIIKACKQCGGCEEKDFRSCCYEEDWNPNPQPDYDDWDDWEDDDWWLYVVSFAPLSFVCLCIVYGHYKKRSNALQPDQNDQNQTQYQTSQFGNFQNYNLNQQNENNDNSYW